jgi:hypothetical protein
MFLPGTIYHMQLITVGQQVDLRGGAAVLYHQVTIFGRGVLLKFFKGPVNTAFEMGAAENKIIAGGNAGSVLCMDTGKAYEQTAY